MRKLLLIFLTLGLIISACGAAATQPAPPAQTRTPIVTPTATQTPTFTITPLPTIPTFTPTFDVSTVVTVTPAEKAECPREDPENTSSIEFGTFPSGKNYVDHPTVERILNSLNAGFPVESLVTELTKLGSNFTFQDITNDGIPDFVITSGSVFQIINVLYCDGGQYKIFPENDVESESLGSENIQFVIRDINQNGIPSIISIGTGRTGLNVNILEWNGTTFADLTGFGAWVPGTGVEGFQLVELGGNNIPSIVLEGKPYYWLYPGEPLRSEIDFYEWNGEIFSQTKRFAAPEYRFQAIQDGDHLTKQGDFINAESIYRETIQSASLDWWSRERFETGRDAVLIFSTPPVFLPDPTEYPRLAAYAYYRIMLLHLVQGQEAEAASTYQTLQSTFSNDLYAAPYVEMATVFWEAYQPTKKMYDGCAAAIQYAVEHPEILIPLGSDHHGWQAKIYQPADVCPFR